MPATEKLGAQSSQLLFPIESQGHVWQGLSKCKSHTDPGPVCEFYDCRLTTGNLGHIRVRIKVAAWVNGSKHSFWDIWGTTEALCQGAFQQHIKTSTHDWAFSSVSPKWLTQLV